MNLIANLMEAFRALTSHKLRSFLTMLGIIIGVAAVISLMSIGTGAQQAITSRIESMGTNLLFISPGALTEAGVRGTRGMGSSLTFEDAQAIAQSIPSASLVAPQVSTFVQVVAGKENVSTRVLGVTAEFQEVRNYSLADGQFITPQQVDSRAKVAVLGSQVAGDLFGGISPVGQSLRIGSYRLRVLGVLESKGGTGLGMEDDMVLVPLTTYQAAFAQQRTTQGRQSVQQIIVQVRDKAEMEEAKQDIAPLLRERHRVAQDDFSIASQEELIGAFSQIAGIMTLFLGSIAGISLLVGGIGIMNIMLVSVTERTREIGIRKAVGAKRRHILTQFLVEAIALSLSGGIGGILIGFGISRLISRLSLGGQSFQTAVSPQVVLLAFSVAVAIGLFFGLYPASRAARLNPADALRYE